MISTSFPKGEGSDTEPQQNGAGAILGQNNGRLYIVTADHVVHSEAGTASTIKVRLQWYPGETFDAELTEHSDPELDIAVLMVRNAARLKAPPTLPFDAVAPVASLKRGADVYAVGYPSGKAWFSRPRPDAISEASFEGIRFDGWIAPGYSGGGLFNDRWQLIGIIQSDTPPDGNAIPIERVLARVKKWGYPVQLGETARAAAPANRIPDAAPAKPASGKPEWASLAGGTPGAVMCAISSNQQLYCWGRGNREGAAAPAVAGSLGPRLMPTPAGVVPRSVWMTANHACFTSVDGRAYCWGSNQNGQVSSAPDPIVESPRLVGDIQFRSLALGNGFSCGLRTPAKPAGAKEASEVYCWGMNKALGIASRSPAPLQGVTFNVFRGSGNTLCGLRDGAPYCVGAGDAGQLGDGNIRPSSTTPVRVAGPAQLLGAVGGATHSCGIGRSGAAFCWGDNKGGALAATADTKQSATPVRVPGRSDFLFVDVGPDRTCARSREGALYCWGANPDGAIGATSPGTVLTPTQIPVAEEVRSFTVGGRYGCALTESRKIYCWGNNQLGQLGNGSTQPSKALVEVQLPVQ